MVVYWCYKGTINRCKHFQTFKYNIIIRQHYDDHDYSV